MAAFSNKYVIFACRLILGIVFILASIDKIAVPEAFAISVHAYRILPLPVVNIAALVIPWTELICGLFLLGGILVRPSSFVLSSLLLVFIGAIFTALLRGMNIDCGCFGAAHSSPVSWMRILEDIGLLWLGVVIFLYPLDWPSFGRKPASAGG